LKLASSDIHDDDGAVIQTSTSNTTDPTTATSQSGQDESRLSLTQQQQQQPHLLTIKQVNLICARLLKEREDTLREEYDRILSTRLDGQ
jgi:hypothetical protein